MRMLPVAACLSAVGLAPALAAADFPYPVVETELENGLGVVLVSMPAEGLVSYWTLVRTGSRDEVEEGVTGFAHFFEHMMFRGSERIPAAEYERIVASMGGDTNAYTTDDYTAYHLSVTREDLPTVIEIEADRFQNLAYAEPEFRTEAGAIYGEYRKNRTSPYLVLDEQIRAAAFEAHTYGHTTMGYEDDIARMPEQYDYSWSFFRRYYRPENAVVVVAGDFDADEVLSLVRSRYGSWEPGYVAPAVREEPPQLEPRRVVVPFDGKTLPILDLSFKSPRFDPEDPVVVAGLLVGDLAFGPTSPLARKLVLEEQRVQSLTPSFARNRDPSLWEVYATVVDPADVPAVEEDVWATLEALREEPIDAGRLADAVSNRRYAFLSGLATPDAVASSLARVVAVTGSFEAVRAFDRTLDEITPAHVQEAVRTYLTEERSTVAILHSADEPLPEPRLAQEPVVLPVAADPNVSLKLWFRVGSQDDPPGKEGLAALTAALVAEGSTASRSYDEILAALHPLAASYGERVDREMTVLTGVAHRDVAARFADLFLDAVVSPALLEADFERLRSRALRTLERRLRYSSDEELGKAALSGEVFAGTGYSHLPLGTIEGLRSITLDDVKSFYERYYTRESVVVGLGGAYSDGWLDRVAVSLARLPAGRSDTPPAPVPAEIEGRRVVLVEKPGTSTAISLGYPIDLLRGDDDFYALWLANSWLGEHRNSIARLYQVIRETRGMNYGDYSYIEAFPEGGRRSMPPTGVGRRQQLFEVWIRPVPEDRAIFALRAALREIDRLIAEGLTAEEFEAHRAFLVKYSRQFATTTAERLGYALDDRFYALDEPHLERFRRRMAELTVDDVNAAIRKHLSTENLVIAMVTEHAEALADALASDAPSPIDYGELEKPAEVLTEDEAIERYPLEIEREAIRIVPVEEMFASGSR